MDFYFYFYFQRGHQEVLKEKREDHAVLRGKEEDHTVLKESREDHVLLFATRLRQQERLCQEERGERTLAGGP